jgi:hypothetical protein
VEFVTFTGVILITDWLFVVFVVVIVIFVFIIIIIINHSPFFVIALVLAVF